MFWDSYISNKWYLLNDKLIFPLFITLRHKLFSYIGFELTAFIHQYITIEYSVLHAGDTTLTRTWSLLTVWWGDRQVKWLQADWEITKEGDTGRMLWVKGTTTARLTTHCRWENKVDSIKERSLVGQEGDLPTYCPPVPHGGQVSGFY